MWRAGPETQRPARHIDMSGAQVRRHSGQPVTEEIVGKLDIASAHVRGSKMQRNTGRDFKRAGPQTQRPARDTDISGAQVRRRSTNSCLHKYGARRVSAWAKDANASVYAA